MPWGALSSAHQIMIVLSMRGGPQYAAQARAAARQTGALGSAVLRTSANMQVASKRTWAYTQALYTARRYAFYATLAVTGLAFAVARMGLRFYNTMQTAKVAFTLFLGSAVAAQRELNYIYGLAALTPFEFPDLVIATRRLLPFVHNLGLTNRLVSSITNALAGMGIITAAGLTRASLQFSHMFAVGRLTGQMLYNLGRDNIPMMQALQQHFHATGEEVRARVAGGLVTATEAARAFNHFIMTSPGFRTAAIAQSTKTLTGAWSTLRDLIGMAAGSGERGLFDSVTKAIRRVDLALLPLIQSRKPVSMYDLARAMDQAVTPRTHIIINLFVTLNTAMKTTIAMMLMVGATISFLLRPLDALGSLFGANELGAKLFGIALGIMVGVLILSRTALFLSAAAYGVWELAVISATAVASLYSIVMGTQGLQLVGLIRRWREWAFAMNTVNRVPAWKTISGFRRHMTDFANKGVIARISRSIFGMAASLRAAALATWEFTAALATNPLTWIVLGVLALTVGLVVLYYKWKYFRDNLLYFAPVIGAALTVAFGPIGAAIVGLLLIIKYWRQVSAILGVNNSRQSSGGGFFAKRPGGGSKNVGATFFGVNIGDLIHRHFATGGRMDRSGLAMVGERGPEVLHLPGGSVVQPLNRVSLDGVGSLAIHIYPQPVVLDGKQIGTAVATATTDKNARMSGR